MAITDAGQGRAMIELTSLKHRMQGRGLQPVEACKRLLVAPSMETRLSPVPGFARVSHIIKWPSQTDVCALGLSYSCFGDLHLFACGSFTLSPNITGMHFYLVSPFPESFNIS